MTTTYDDPQPGGIVLYVIETSASMIGMSRGKAVRVTARSYDHAGNPTGVELEYWAHPDQGDVPRVGDKLRLTIEAVQP